MSKRPEVIALRKTIMDYLEANGGATADGLDALIETNTQMIGWPERHMLTNRIREITDVIRAKQDRIAELQAALEAAKAECTCGSQSNTCGQQSQGELTCSMPLFVQWLLPLVAKRMDASEIPAGSKT